jgi:hypothetical protein
MNIQKALTFLFLLLTINIFSQEKYKVVYDYDSEIIAYYKVDKANKVTDTLVKPQIKRNSLVEIELKNINPFAIDVIADIKEEQIFSSGGGFDFSSIMGSVNSFSNGKLNLNIANLPTDNISKKSGSRGVTISNNFADLNNKTSNISALKTTLVSNLLNPNLNKDYILDNIIKTASQEKDARLPDPNQNFYVYLTLLEKIVLEDKSSLVMDINEMTKEVDSQMDSEETLSRGELKERNYLSNDLQKLLSSLNESSFQTVEDLNKIKSLYTLLEASNFTRTYDYQIEADKINIELKFVKSVFANSLNNSENIIGNNNTLKTRNIKLYSKGGFKVNTGIALTLNSFGSKSKDFYISEDGTIGGDSNNYLTPNLSTMINFYPYMGENFNLGGSFGLSIPISGDNNINGISFLLGPSAHFGSKSRLSLSGGLAYGPVKKLINGLEIGDSTSLSSIDNLTKTIYDFGYFFGISFNLFDLN